METWVLTLLPTHTTHLCSHAQQRRTAWPELVRLWPGPLCPNPQGQGPGQQSVLGGSGAGGGRHIPPARTWAPARTHPPGRPPQPEGLCVWLAPAKPSSADSGQPAEVTALLFSPHLAHRTPQQILCGKAERTAGPETGAHSPGPSCPLPGNRAWQELHAQEGLDGGFRSMAEGTRLLGLSLSWVLAEVPLKELGFHCAQRAPASWWNLCFLCIWNSTPGWSPQCLRGAGAPHQGLCLSKPPTAVGPRRVRPDARLQLRPS